MLAMDSVSKDNVHYMYVCVHEILNCINELYTLHGQYRISWSYIIVFLY